MSTTESELKLEQAPLFVAPEPSPDSQCGKILAALRAARAGGPTEGWVTMPDLVELSGSYNIHSRIDELRSKFGIKIDNETDNSVRPHRSKYRLIL